MIPMRHAIYILSAAFVLVWTSIASAGPAFIIFYAYDNPSLTSDGNATVESAVSAAKSNTGAICVTGYADTAEHNPAELSAARAKAVAAKMESLGVATGRIQTKGMGTREPMIETPPNTKEPQNRRVVIEIGRAC
jgi:OmpA-OmpF porin, OOP family